MFVIHPALIIIADTMNLIFEEAYSGFDIRVDGFVLVIVHTFTIFYVIYVKAYRGRCERKKGGNYGFWVLKSIYQRSARLTPLPDLPVSWWEVPTWYWCCCIWTARLYCSRGCPSNRRRPSDRWQQHGRGWWCRDSGCDSCQIHNPETNHKHRDNEPWWRWTRYIHCFKSVF